MRTVCSASYPTIRGFQTELAERWTQPGVRVLFLHLVQKNTLAYLQHGERRVNTQCKTKIVTLSISALLRKYILPHEMQT